MKFKSAIIGLGQMGSALAKKLKEQSIVLYDVDVNKARNLSKNLSKQYVKSADELNDVSYFFIVLPPGEVPSYIKSNRLKGVVFINMATDVNTSDLHQYILPSQRVIGAKILGQAKAIEMGLRPLVITETTNQKDFLTLSNLLSDFGKVIKCKESIVKDVNYYIAKETLRMFLGAKRKLQQDNIGSNVIETALKVVSIGTILNFKGKDLDDYEKKIIRDLANEDESINIGGVY